jgi:DNA-directed RNA polymerase specialized sigma24 family protein
MLDATLSFYMDGLYGYAMVLTCDATVAADLVQETYVRGLRATEALRATSNVKSWLFAILREIASAGRRNRLYGVTFCACSARPRGARHTIAYCIYV